MRSGFECALFGPEIRPRAKHPIIQHKQRMACYQRAVAIILVLYCCWMSFSSGLDFLWESFLLPIFLFSIFADAFLIVALSQSVSQSLLAGFCITSFRRVFCCFCLFHQSMSMTLSVARLLPHYSFIYVHFIHTLTYLRAAKYKRSAVAAYVGAVASAVIAYRSRTLRCTFFSFVRCDTNAIAIDEALRFLLVLRHLMTHTDSYYLNILPVSLFRFAEMVSLRYFHFIVAFFLRILLFGSFFSSFLKLNAVKMWLQCKLQDSHRESNLILHIKDKANEQQ